MFRLRGYIYLRPVCILFLSARASHQTEGNGDLEQDALQGSRGAHRRPDWLHVSFGIYTYAADLILLFLAACGPP